VQCVLCMYARVLTCCSAFARPKLKLIAAVPGLVEEWSKRARPRGTVKSVPTEEKTHVNSSNFDYLFRLPIRKVPKLPTPLIALIGFVLFLGSPSSHALFAS